MKMSRPPTGAAFVALSVLLFCIAIGGFSRFACGQSERKTPAAQLEGGAVSVRLPIPIVETGQAPFYVAMDKGFYKEHGLNVHFELGSPELNPIKMVAAGENDFGVIGGPDTLLVARSRGLPLKAIAVIHRNSNFSCIVTLKSSGITTPQQLNGNKVGFFYGHISTEILRNLFRRTGTRVTEVDTGFNYTLLTSRNVDASWEFNVTAGLALPAQGVEINIINPADYGIISHGYTIFAREDYIEKHPDIVRTFLQETLNGVMAVVANPHEGIAAIERRDTKTPHEVLVRRQAGYNSVTSASDTYPAGYMDLMMFEETYNRLTEEGVFTKPFNVRDVYTTRFLEEIHGRKF